MRRVKWQSVVWTGISFLVLLGTLLWVPQAMAQFNASLSGTVTDTSGAVIPGATVSLKNNGTQVKRDTTTSGDGFYQFNSLPPGDYEVTVTAPNFKTASFDNVSVVAESPRSLDARLSTGGASETVTVNANEIPLLQTSDASIGGTLTGETLQRVPTVGRDPYELLRTAPGITGDSARSGTGGAVFLPNGGGPGQSNSGIFQTENQIQISAAGQRTADNNFMIDGVSVNSLGQAGAAVVTPNEEAVGSITVVSTSFSAEDGRNTGAQIKVVTKSGTDQFHGGLNFLYDEPGLNAFNAYGGPNGQKTLRVQNKQRDYAASLGGPIFKDKLFFFLSFEGYKSSNTSFPSQFVETPEFRQFVSSQRAGSIAASIVGAPGGTPRIRNVLPVDCTTPVVISGPCTPVAGGLDLGSPFGATGTYVPLSQSSSGSGLDGVPDVQFVQLIQPQHTRGNQYNARGDWYLTPHDQIAGSLYFTKLDNYTPSGATDSRQYADVPFKPLNSAATLLYIHTFGPSLLNEFRINGTRFADNGITDSAGVVNWGIPYINVQNMPFDSINDINFGTSQSSTTPAVFAENTYEARDMVTKTFGSHTLKMGAEYRIEQDNNNLAGASRPVYAFGGIWNFANDTPIFEAITVDPNTGGVPNAKRYLNDHYIGAFGQHDWKVNANLTLNTGIRWEYFEPLYNKGFKINYPTLGTTPGRELIDVSLTPHNHLWDSEFHDFSPKFGFAFTPPMSNNKMVIRGGFALAYNRLAAALFDPAVEDGPGYLNFNLCCGTAATDFGTPFAGGQIQYQQGSSSSPFSFAPNPALATGVNSRGLPNNGAQIEVYGAHPTTHTPYSYLYSLEVQRELPKQFVATIGYQGSTGRHYSRLVNQVFVYATSAGTESTPFGGGAYFAQNDSNQYYNGGNAHLQKRFSDGFTLDAIYTYSKSMDQVSNGDSANSNANQTDPAHNATELGPSDYDVRHRITVTGLWDLPKIHSGNAIVKAVANGWQLNGVYTYHTGFPFTPVTFALHGIPTVPNAFTIGPVRPLAYLGGVHTSCSNSPYITGSDVADRGADGTDGGKNSFNITPPTDGSGTPPGIGRNSFRGPCYQDADLSAAKQIVFSAFGREDMRLRFQANFYNAFNKLNLTPFTNGNANSSALIESPNFGKAQSADAGRVIEFVARFQF
jgi:hypothetical protein